MGKISEGRRRGIGHADLEPAVVKVLTAAGPRGMTKAEIVAAVGATTAVSVQRALVRLRGRDAQIESGGARRRWRLVQPFAMPLESPEADDVIAVLVAKAILIPLADADLVERIERLAEQLDERRRKRDGTTGLPMTAPMTATLTLGTKIEPGVLRTLLGACRRRVLRILYESPWKSPGDRRRWYEIEPWALRVHDGAAYLRAWRRDAAAARTFRIAQIETIEEMPDTKRVGRVPAPGAMWGDEDPAFGIDRDRPGVAVVVMHGAVARWVRRVEWHPTQRDRWLEEAEVLERTVPYRSCRELARRIASVYDAVRRIEPPLLRDAVLAIVRGGMEIELPAVMQRVPASADPKPRGLPAESHAGTRVQFLKR